MRFIEPGDAIVLLEDGVYAASEGVESGMANAGVAVYAVAADVSARGIDVIDSVSIIDYDGFVRLCTEHDVVKNWS